MKSTLHTKVSVQYKLEQIRKGKVISSMPFRPHMMTDTFLDKVATINSWLHGINNPILGEGVTPTAVRRDSGAVTFTQSTNTITASSGFFIVSDTGRLFKWGTGAAGVEGYLTYVNSTTATYTVSQTVAAPEVGTVWYVNTDSLQTPILSLSWSKNNDALENFSTGSALSGVYTDTSQTTFYSSAFAANKTVTEIGFNSTNSNSGLCDRDLISPTVAFLIGDQAKVTIQILRSYSSITPVACSNVATGYNSAGQIQIESLYQNLGVGVAAFNSSGGIAASNGVCLEPGTSQPVPHGVFNASASFSAFNLNTPGAIPSGPGKNGTYLSYGTGNYYIDSEALFTISEGNGTVYGVCIGGAGLGGSLVKIIFTSTFTKTASQTLKTTWRKSWSRVLTN